MSLHASSNPAGIQRTISKRRTEPIEGERVLARLGDGLSHPDTKLPHYNAAVMVLMKAFSGVGNLYYGLSPEHRENEQLVQAAMNMFAVAAYTNDYFRDRSADATPPDQSENTPKTESVAFSQSESTMHQTNGSKIKNALFSKYGHMASYLVMQGAAALEGRSKSNAGDMETGNNLIKWAAFQSVFIVVNTVYEHFKHAQELAAEKDAHRGEMAR